MNRLIPIITFLLCSSLFLGAQTNELVFEAYPISSPQPDDLIAAAKMLIGDKGKMVYDKVSHKLLVYAPKKEHALIAELLEKAIPSGINIQIEVAVDEAEDTSASKASVSASGTYKKGSDGKSKTEIKIKPDIEARSSIRTGRTVQTLVVSDGNSAAIEIGTDIPFSDWLVEFGRQWGYIQQNIKYRRVGASLRILPRIIDKEKGIISIKLIPEISALPEKEDDFTTVKFINVSTELLARDGETITFGGSSNNKEFYDKFLIGIGREGTRKKMQMTLTPRLIKTK